MWTKRTKAAEVTWRTTVEGPAWRSIRYEGLIELCVNDDEVASYRSVVSVAQYGKISTHPLPDTTDLALAQARVEAKIKAMIGGGFHH
jgi:hypothetical protein